VFPATTLPGCFFVVANPGELVSDKGRKLQAAHYVGVVHADGTTTVWSPRLGYKRAAARMVADALAQLRIDGKVK
jgi:hypothetical protein